MQLREGQLIVSATDLVGFLECGHLSALDLAVARGRLDKPHDKDATLDLIRDRGGRHEQRYITLLEYERERNVRRLAADWDRPYEERAAETIDLMRQGVDVIYQATVFDGRWVGHPDFLLRKAGAPPPHLSTPARSASGLGTDWHYEVADTKLAHTPKASALLQICSYVDQIAQIQGGAPEKVYVVTGGAEIKEHAFRTAEMMAYYRHAKARFEQALAAGLDFTKSYPEPTTHCDVCRWKATCNRRWHADDALPIVAGITRAQRDALRALGVNTRGALANLAPAPASFAKVTNQARLQVESNHVSAPKYELLEPEEDSTKTWVADRGLSALPEPSEGDLFFDIEGDPFAFWEGLEYLFGIWEIPGTDSIWDTNPYTGLWALSREEERRQFEAVIDRFTRRLADFPQMHVYHYGAYEPSHLKILAGRHATREEELDELLRKRVFVDLYRVVRQGLQAGVESYSIKRLEPLYGYERKIDLRDAGDSIVEFEFWLDRFQEDEIDDKTLRADIEAYNRDDCISTHRLRDWLEYTLRPEAAQKFGAELPRPPTDVRPTSTELTARQAEVHALEEKLEAKGDEATTLLANLLDWHRRENKASWWRYYDLMAKSDDELLEEPEPIAGLEFVERIVREGKRVTTDDWRYRFPVQEHRIDVGSEVHDPQLPDDQSKTGTVAAIDEDALTIDIRRSKDWFGQHPTAIVPLNIYRAPAQQDAMLRVGEWVSGNEIGSDSSPWRAARDLLQRKPPRVEGGNGGSLVEEGESGPQAALRISRSLDRTTLAIQGPPGSGKSTTGAQMIVDLVKHGRLVGVTANSHKVIDALLDKVEVAAQEGGVTLRALHKMDKDDEPEFVDCFAECVFDNDKVVEALASRSAQVVGGTAWLWAREDVVGLIDTLFVDEAGQVSLANVVAVSGTSRNVVLLGDPQQLDQPVQGAHPPGAERSALSHFLGDKETVEAERGIFFGQTHRLHPLICSFTSNLFYEGRLMPDPALVNQCLLPDGLPRDFEWLAGSGLRWVPEPHDARTNESPEEAEQVCEIWNALVGTTWVDRTGTQREIRAEDIVIVSPFNAHRLLVQEQLPQARVGTVDKFQGQEAPISIYTMATSRPEDAPRGLRFLLSLNRLNVATSRAQALTVVVASPLLLEAVVSTPQDLHMANAMCSFVESAVSQ